MMLLIFGLVGMSIYSAPKKIVDDINNDDEIQMPLLNEIDGEDGSSNIGKRRKITRRMKSDVSEDKGDFDDAETDQEEEPICKKDDDGMAFFGGKIRLSRRQLGESYWMSCQYLHCPSTQLIIVCFTVLDRYLGCNIQWLVGQLQICTNALRKPRRIQWCWILDQLLLRINDRHYISMDLSISIQYLYLGR